MNKVILIGHLASDPEIRTTQSGISCATFRIAVQRRFANQQGQREADFISCVAWRNTADFIHKYFIKGNKIALDGALQVRAYDSQDGSRRYATEVIVDNAEFVAPRAESASAPSSAPHVQDRPRQTRMDTSSRMNDTFHEYTEDDLPF